MVSRISVMVTRILKGKLDRAILLPPVRSSESKIEAGVIQRLKRSVAQPKRAENMVLKVFSQSLIAIQPRDLP